MWLVVTGAPDSVTVRIDAELDLFASVRLGAILTDLIVWQGNLSVAVDLRGFCGTDPAAIEVVGAAAAAANARGGTLTLIGTAPGSVDALTAAGLGGLISSGPAGHRAPIAAPAEANCRSRHPAGRALSRLEGH